MSHRLKTTALWLAITFTACDTGTEPPNNQNPPPPSAPVAPSNLVATPMSSSQVRLNWTDASNNEDAFVIERCSGPGCSTFAPFVTTVPNLTVTTDNSVTAQTSYSYRVRASNSVGASSFSNIATAVTMSASAIPAPPTSPAATAVSSSRIDLAWTDASDNEDGFKIERCQGAGCTNFGPYLTMPFPNGTSHSSALLAASTTYRFRIQSYNGSGGSAFAGPVEATTAAAVIPHAAPSALVATAVSSSRIDLTWTDNSSNEDAFRLERCEGAGCSNFASIGYTPGTSWSDLSRTAQTTYSYRVRASNGAGTSAYSNVASATTATATTIPAPPSGLTATATSGARISLTWTDNATNEDGFQVERCEGAGCANFSHYSSLPANGTNLQTAPLTPGTSYSFRVRAYNGAGTSPYSGTATATTLAAPPAAPSNLTATAVSSSRIDLSWTDNANNESGFELERCSGAGCSSFTLLTSPGANATTYPNTGLSASTSYSYRIRALHPTAGPSSYSATATAVTQAAQASPIISVSVTSRTFNATQGGANPGAQQAQVGNSGGGTLTGLQVTENPSAPWLTVTLSSTTAPATLTFQATTGSLAGGTYTTTVNVSSPVASNSPRSVTVTFIVAAAPSEITGYATQDNVLVVDYLDATWANRTFNNSDLFIGCNWDVGPTFTSYLCYESLLRFDIQSQIAGRTIQSAELRLYPNGLGADQQTNFRVAAVARAWNTANVTFNSLHNGSEVYTAGQSQRAAPTTTAVPYTFDVTLIVRNWADGTFANHGLLIWDAWLSEPAYAALRLVLFDSSEEFAAPATRPQLVIRFQ